MGKSVFGLIFICISLNINAQDSLCVFNVKGNVYKLSSGMMTLNKGMFLNPASKVMLEEGAELVSINSKGDAFKVSNSGTFNYDTILNSRFESDEASLTTKYFKFIWNEFLNREDAKTIIGGVFRGEVLMQYPQDSVRLASQRLKFRWSSEEGVDTYYFFLRTSESEDLLKLAVQGTELSLYKNQSKLEEQIDYEWAISKDEFPNLNNLPFYRFRLISKSEYYQAISNYQSLIDDFSKMGLSKERIEQEICETYGLCKQ